MTQRGRLWGTLCLLGMVLLCPVMASAQGSMSPLAGQAGGNGFKVGDGRLHPFLDLETRLDSGVGYFPPSDGSGPGTVSRDLSGELLLHLRPGFVLELPSPKVAIDLTANLDYVLYTGLLTANSSKTSHLQAQADLTARIHEERPVSFVITDHFSRSDRTRTAAVGAGVLSVFNELRASMPIRPGGGAIEVTPELAWAMESFWSLGALPPEGCGDGACDPVSLETFDYHNIQGGVDARWRFLPKTALVVDTDFNLRSYAKGNHPEARLLRAMVGLSGLVTPKVAVTAKAGWGQDFGTTGGGTFITHLEGTYMMSPTLTFKGGYLRSLEPVSAYGLYSDDRGYLEARALYGGKLALRGALSYDYLNYRSATSPRSDNLFTLDMGPDYPIRPWLLGGAGYLLNLRASSVSGPGLNYTRHVAYFRLTVKY